MKNKKVKIEDRKRKNVLRSELNRIMPVVKEKYKPEKVILFGSFASGNVSETSDIDLLILKKSRKRYLDRIDEFLKIVRPKVSMDIFILTPQEARRKNPYLAEIFQKGKVLYE